jgi:hypothetical protein
MKKKTCLEDHTKKELIDIICEMQDYEFKAECHIISQAERIRKLLKERRLKMAVNNKRGKP